MKLVTLKIPQHRGEPSHFVEFTTITLPRPDAFIRIITTLPGGGIAVGIGVT
jgi:hypothetical protein